MKKVLVWLLALTLVAAPSAAALDRKQAQALLRVAVKLSGLRAREQVRIVIERPAPFRQRRAKLLDRSYPAAAQAYDEKVYRALGLVTGGEGVLRKTLARGRAADRRVRPVLPHRLRPVRCGRAARRRCTSSSTRSSTSTSTCAARLACPAAATRRSPRPQRSRVTPLSSRRPPAIRKASGTATLTRFVELQRGFTSSVGLRFAADLRNLGGTKAVLESLRRFPATSEQLFHLDKYLERERAVPIVLPVSAGGATLAGDGTFGELDVRALLAVFGVPRLDRAATGWGGGRTAVYHGTAGDAVAIALDWDTDRDAAEWADAVAAYVDEAFDKATPGPPAPTSCAATACWQIGARAIAFDHTGARTTLVLGVDLAQAELLARTLLGEL